MVRRTGRVLQNGIGCTGSVIATVPDLPRALPTGGCGAPSLAATRRAMRRIRDVVVAELGRVSGVAPAELYLTKRTTASAIPRIEMA